VAAFTAASLVIGTVCADLVPDEGDFLTFGSVSGDFSNITALEINDDLQALLSPRWMLVVEEVEDEYCTKQEVKNSVEEIY